MIRELSIRERALRLPPGSVKESRTLVFEEDGIEKASLSFMPYNGYTFVHAATGDGSFALASLVQRLMRECTTDEILFHVDVPNELMERFVRDRCEVKQIWAVMKVRK